MLSAVWACTTKMFTTPPKNPSENHMKRLKKIVVVAGAAAALGLAAGNLSAQDRPRGGGGDPEQWRQRAMERYREQFEVKSDDEWKVIQTRIEKVMEARRDLGPGGFGGGMMFGRGGRRGGDNGGGGGAAGGGGGDQAGRQRFGPEPSPEAEALQKAIEAKAPADEIKAKLAKYRESRKLKEEKLTQAQDELKKVLSVRQEAVAVAGGLLQ